MHGSSQDNMVLFRVCLLFLLTFINVKHLVVGKANSMFAIECVALLQVLGSSMGIGSY